jgi:hypothetical protein
LTIGHGVITHAILMNFQENVYNHTKLLRFLWINGCFLS